MGLIAALKRAYPTKPGAVSHGSDNCLLKIARPGTPSSNKRQRKNCEKDAVLRLPSADKCGNYRHNKITPGARVATGLFVALIKCQMEVQPMFCRCEAHSN